MKLSTAGLGLLSALVLGWMASARASQEPDIEQIMQRKLDHAHAVLEALIFEDYDSLQESAVELERLSREAGWFVLQTPEYHQRSSAFRAAASEIGAAAKERNLEGATLGYVDMTLKCVQCHALLRGVRRAGSFAPGLGQNAQQSGEAR